MSKAFTTLIAFLTLFAPALASAQSAVTVSAEEVPMAATVDVANKLVMVTGALSSNDEIVQVVVPELPQGSWTVIKAEVNLTNEPWRAWEITFGENTKIEESGKGLSSRQFFKTHAVGKRNALVFEGGEVLPGESVLKVFPVEQVEVGSLEMSHNRIVGEVKAAHIEEGFAEKPVVTFILPTEFVQ